MGWGDASFAFHLILKLAIFHLPKTISGANFFAEKNRLIAKRSRKPFWAVIKDPRCLFGIVFGAERRVGREGFVGEVLLAGIKDSNVPSI